MRTDKIIDLLGRKVKEVITGRKGIVTSVCFDLYGCVQAGVSRTTKSGDSKFDWYDINRLTIAGKTRAMPVPTFEYVNLKDNHGPEDKSGLKIG